jgi:hypothetical protein
MSEESLTTDQVAALIAEQTGVRTAPGTIRTWRVRGQGPGYRRVNRAVRYRRDDVLRWLDSQLVAR